MPSFSARSAFASLGVSDCDLSVYGPNGFFRQFQGSFSGLSNPQLDVRAYYNAQSNAIALAIANPSPRTADITILNRYTAKRVSLAINSGQTDSRYFSLARFSGWYDFVITLESDQTIANHFAGHVETGKDSISDPALSGPWDVDGGKPDGE